MELIIPPTAHDVSTHLEWKHRRSPPPRRLRFQRHPSGVSAARSIEALRFCSLGRISGIIELFFVALVGVSNEPICQARVSVIIADSPLSSHSRSH
ncbi:hypothetical protein FH972_008837 [Carpinus fangiana]|uniref:Uncharacterized protein n=1 Tax=Carpinus fangiana TaxID=176857 RepID=A0A5N6R265_9ROSI|nr:hypothetical protein FH972_008837 [Carpinus fangiana]